MGLSKGGNAGFGYLVAGLAAGPARFGVVPPAVDAPILVEVDEVHQQLPTRGTAEALGVPARPMAGPRRKHRHVASAQPSAALRGQGGRGGGVKMADGVRRRELGASKWWVGVWKWWLGASKWWPG